MERLPIEREFALLWNIGFMLLRTIANVEYYDQYVLIECFTSYFMFILAVLSHSPGVVYYHLFLRRETRIPGVAPILFLNRNLFVHRGQKSYTPTAFGKLWTTPGVKMLMHYTCLIITLNPLYKTGPRRNTSRANKVKYTH